MEKRTPTAVRWLVRWVLSLGKGEESSAPVLLPLTPEYNPKKHGVYFDAIESALTDPKREVRNIALTGSYGVGKSSILTEVAKRHKRDVIAVSLSTLGFPDDEPLPAGDAAKAASTKTNRIQKEIVKQLLYSQDPLKTPGSRYRRTTGFRFWRTLWLTALLSLPVAVIFFLAGWTASIAAFVPRASELPWLGHLIVFVASTALLVSLLALFHNRFQIEKLGAGAATISLSAKSATYFDEYLDEIVYFFEAVKRDIVIFEDIDRFDDAHIFETLRSLNSILNGAKQLKGRKIRFIYAIKDSIFDELGTRAAKEELPDEDADTRTGSQKERMDAAEAEVARANRTKFFDLVIPVVPFITHRSARDLLVQTLSKDLEHSVSDELIDLTARYVADMRLIKNIRNEYAIFKRQVIDSGSLNLSEDGLFAMVLYKSIHLSEFELIKLGKSNLDSLYREGRALVAANIKTLNATIRGARVRRQRLSISADDAGKLGDLFDDHILLTLRHLGLTPAQTQARTMDGVEVDDAMLHTPEFWEKYAANDGVVEVSYYRPNYGRYESLSFKRADVAQAIRRPIDSAAWVKEAQTRFDAEITRAVAARDFLSHADMSDLMQRTEFKLTVGNKEYSFEHRVRRHLDSELAIRLLEAGYIDRNFTLYTSTFYTDRVSATATNYILKNVDPNTIDIHFELEPQDVEAVLRERGRTILSEKSAYNVSVLDYLVESDPAGLDVLIGRLLEPGDEEQELLLAYLDKGTHAWKFVEALAPRWSAVLTFLVSEAGLNDEARLMLLNAALQSTSSDLSYETDDALGAFLLESYRNLGVFTSDATSADTCERVAKIVQSMGIKLPSLIELSREMKRAVVSTGGYEVTRENLLLALEASEHSLSLNAIRESNKDVYDRVLVDLNNYVAALGDEHATITEPADFGSILNDIAQQDQDALSSIVARSAVECRIDDLNDTRNATWSVLADHSRFPVTFVNVSTYINELGLNDPLARMLDAAGTIETEDDADEEAKTEIGLTILSAAQHILSAKVRAELVGSLNITNYIDAASIPREKGNLLGWLLVEDVVEDDAATFTALTAGDTDGLAFAISRSTEFPNFMTTAEVTPSNVGLLVNHGLVQEQVKDAILARFTELTVGTSRASLMLIARYAVEHGKSVTVDEVARLARDGVDASLVVALLQHHLSAVGIAELAPILVSLGGEFAKLSAANGKRPRIPNTSANRALVDRLKELGIASTDTETNGEIKVNMKQG